MHWWELSSHLGQWAFLPTTMAQAWIRCPEPEFWKKRLQHCTVKGNWPDPRAFGAGGPKVAKLGEALPLISPGWTSSFGHEEEVN